MYSLSLAYSFGGQLSEGIAMAERAQILARESGDHMVLAALTALLEQQREAKQERESLSGGPG